jgi:hypothetical protein
MPRLDRAAASVSFTAQIRALTDWGVLRQDEGRAFLADLKAEAGLHADNPVRVEALNRVRIRLFGLVGDERLKLDQFGPLFRDFYDIAEFATGFDR